MVLWLFAEGAASAGLPRKKKIAGIRGAGHFL